ncbi:anti-sigma B factor antagonist [Desulfatibacillum alkenivorans DSM 16219]|jgi:anti-sigma B factor antagonist|uniref:Anti-sigma factor antagonist n=1 Tax=Desulfatibacillum alkenivorans DSM 16219 TaxID=1121393 RepID=A0A1M6XB36_9BACT|nr:STAS domain-containing protein [Desulfatibacillum alkenivorans]SHL03171.1 anti-sigma B factor antagonist [Desulfatibacillum alkenivorans DSM 16219]
MSVRTRHEKYGEIAVIHAPERLRADESGEFRQTLKEIVDQGINRLVVDLSETTAMDSSGLGALVSRIAVTRQNGGDVRLAGCNETVNSLLAITHLDQVFESFDDVKEAVESFS